MPEQETIDRARQDAREGKSPSTQAGEFVREEIHHIREGKHGAASTKQAIAIALSKARKAGVDLPPAPGRRRTKSASSRRRKPTAKSSKRRAAASLRRLKRKGHAAASHTALSRHAKAVAKKRRRRSA
jgi:Family of unknown function (DUF6496)